MTPEVFASLGQTLGGIGVLALVVWFIARDHRRDDGALDAQADKTAIALLKVHREERQDMRDEMNKLRERVAVMEDRERNQAEVLQIHAAWDHMMIQALKRVDPSMDLGDAPPLYPPHHLHPETHAPGGLT